MVIDILIKVNIQTNLQIANNRINNKYIKFVRQVKDLEDGIYTKERPELFDGVIIKNIVQNVKLIRCVGD